MKNKSKLKRKVTITVEDLVEVAFLPDDLKPSIFRQCTRGLYENGYDCLVDYVKSNPPEFGYNPSTTRVATVLSKLNSKHYRDIGVGVLVDMVNLITKNGSEYARYWLHFLIPPLSAAASTGRVKGINREALRAVLINEADQLPECDALCLLKIIDKQEGDE